MKNIFRFKSKRYEALVRIIFFSFSLILITNKMVNAQNEVDVIRKSWLQHSDAPHSLYYYLTGDAYKILDVRALETSKMTTPGDWQKRQSKMRQNMWDVLGPFTDKTPLNAKITSKVKKDGYKVENIIYESLPGFYVTASLFIPNKVKKPAPAILFCSGHSTAVYRLKSYQTPLLNLVKKGFIVLAIDPIGQGERLQYFNPETGKSDIGSSTKEHSYPSVQVSLIGKSVARYFVWDGIRGIDYLVSRKEVDPKRIGVHGLSGGGTQTAYISALDERVAASAPAGYITSYRRLMESIGVQDGEQNFYHGISRGIDHADFIEMRAPKPTLIMATTRDFFSIQGTRETFNELKKVYGLFGKPDNIEKTEDDHGHGYTKKNREAMYAFFQKHLNNPGSSMEEDVDYPDPNELQKTSTGQLSTSLGGESVFSLNHKEAMKLAVELQASRSDIEKHLSGVVPSAKKFSGYKDPVLTDAPVFTGRIQREGYVIEKYFVKGEGDYVIPYILFIPDKANKKAVLYLHPEGKSAESDVGGEMQWFVDNGFTVVAPDLLGVGEMSSTVFKGDANIRNISYNIWYTAMLVGRSIVGIQASDVVKLTHLIKKNHSIEEIYGVARKELSPVLLHAAAFYPSIKRIALIEPYDSYSSIVMNRFYYPGFVFSLVPGALTAYDLPDLAACLSPRKLFVAGVTDGNGKNTDVTTIDNLSIIPKAYQLKNANNNLNVQSSAKPEDMDGFFMEWIK